MEDTSEISDLCDEEESLLKMKTNSENARTLAWILRSLHHRQSMAENLELRKWIAKITEINSNCLSRGEK